MAAGTFTTVETVLKRVKLTVNDTSTTAANQWLSDAQYQTFIDDAIEEIHTTHTFRHMAAGVWVADGGYWGGKPYVLAPDNATLPFAVAADCTYSFTCWGSVRQLTGSTDTTDSYTCTGLRINFPNIIAPLCEYLAMFRSLPMSQSMGIAPNVIAAHFLDMASMWKC